MWTKPVAARVPDPAEDRLINTPAPFPFAVGKHSFQGEPFARKVFDGRLEPVTDGSLVAPRPTFVMDVQEIGADGLSANATINGKPVKFELGTHQWLHTPRQRMASFWRTSWMEDWVSGLSFGVGPLNDTKVPLDPEHRLREQQWNLWLQVPLDAPTECSFQMRCDVDLVDGVQRSVGIERQPEPLEQTGSPIFR